LRLRRYLILCLLYCLWWPATWARADQLRLKDGRVVEAEEVWEIGNDLWFRQGKIISSVAKAEVLRIVRPQPESASKTDPSSSLDTTGDEVKVIGVRPHTTTHIALKDGAQIDADAVWEVGDRVAYRLGNMQTFIDREAVERVTQAATTSSQPSPFTPSLRFTTGNTGLDQLIAHSASDHAINPLLIYLVMREESGFNHRAVSRTGARGLMQLMPATARRLGVRNIHDPVENVEAGARYLKSLIELFKGDVNLALAAYNAGEEAIIRHGYRVPPYRETQNYVRRINAAYRRAMSSKF